MREDFDVRCVTDDCFFRRNFDYGTGPFHDITGINNSDIVSSVRKKKIKKKKKISYVDLEELSIQFFKVATNG